jgi:ubiquinone/menaquinone biosynthesis C-methylase UbiE
LHYDDARQGFKTEAGDYYPLVDGIVDFLWRDPKDRLSEKILEAYDALALEYDKFVTSQNALTKLYNVVFRGFASDSFGYEVVKYIPEDFSGALVDCPVGTGVFTSEKYAKIPNASILVVEYSLNMLLEAKKKYQAHKIENVLYVLADMRKMPFADNSVDRVLSMNGFHAIAGKDKALSEVSRILKPGGGFSGCFYVRGRRKLTDVFVSLYHKPKRWFIAPFYSEKDVIDKFSPHFEFRQVLFFKPIIVFESRRKPRD